VGQTERCQPWHRDRTEHSDKYQHTSGTMKDGSQHHIAQSYCPCKAYCNYQPCQESVVHERGGNPHRSIAKRTRDQRLSDLCSHRRPCNARQSWLGSLRRAYPKLDYRMYPHHSRDTPIPWKSCLCKWKM